MRPLEICLAVLTICTAVCIATGRVRQIDRLLMMACIAVAGAQIGFEGARWQMSPAYLAVSAIGIVAFKFGKWRTGVKIVAISSTVMLAAAGILFSIVLPVFHLPRPTGPYPVGTTTLYFKDSSRADDAAPVPGTPRELVVQLWYPAEVSSNRLARYREPRETRGISAYQNLISTNSHLDALPASAGSPFPVILFSPGWKSRRTIDTFLTEELASNGYIVASIDHTYNSRRVAFPDGRVAIGVAQDDVAFPEISTAERVREIWDKELLKWVADQRFVLDQLEIMNDSRGTPWWGKLNTHLAGAIGHSFGGAAAVKLCAADSRTTAAIDMDGWLFGAIGGRGPNKQVLVMYTSESGPESGPDGTVARVLNAADSVETKDSLSKFGGYVLVVNGAQHTDFTDQPLVSPLKRISYRGSVPVREMQQIVRTYVVAFFNKTLRGIDSEILNASSSPYPVVSLKYWPAATGAARTPPHGAAQ